MSRLLAVLGVIAGLAGSAHANGLLIPTEKKVPPLALLNQQVSISIEDQVAVTRVEQVFRNHTANDLEATYVFPVPKGASVREFAMWVGGVKTLGQLLPADEARQIYTDIVQRTKDPGLLEYMDANLFRLKVFPVPASGEQKIALSYTSVAESAHGMIEYRYPLKTDAKALETLDKFSLNVQLKSQHRLQSIYSPSHAVTITRTGDHEAGIVFEKSQTRLDKDFQLFYTTGDKDIGLTTLTHRPWSSRDGYFMLLISPRAELSKEQQTPRDVVFVLDTSGSMAGKRILQARNALRFCLSNLNEKDRFAVLHFANVVNKHNDTLEQATVDNIDHARKWVERLEATGGTAIQPALEAALEMRPSEKERTFTVVFFTDGRPTVGETDAKRIQANALSKNSANTRIFTFGVGDDVNATLLDGLAEQSRAVSTFVRENEDIEERVSSFYSKINHPVFTNLRLTAGAGIKLTEVYPPELPDLFHGSQLVVLGRYTGDGDASLKLVGNLGRHAQEFTYKATFPAQTKDEKTFVEDLWARRKVGFLLDQIRRNGEVAELKDEVIRLAKRHGITTPYTSFLVAPDEVAGDTRQRKSKEAARPDVRFQIEPPSGATFGIYNPSLQPPLAVPAPVSGNGLMGMRGTSFAPNGNGILGGGTVPFGGFGVQGGSNNSGPGTGFGGAGYGVGPPRDPKNPIASTPVAPKVIPVGDLAIPVPQVTSSPTPPAKKDPGSSNAPTTRGKESKTISDGTSNTIGYADRGPTTTAGASTSSLDQIRRMFADGRHAELDSGRVAIDLAEYLKGLRSDDRADRGLLREVNGRNCVQVNGVWIDDVFNDKIATVTIKGFGKAYFRMLERQPRMREVFALGNYVIWLTPCGDALIVDPDGGRDDMPDVEIDRLFQERNK